MCKKEEIMFKREWILPEQGYEAALKALEGELAPYRAEGYFTAPDGAPLYYESVCREENRKAILLLHGFTEFIGKYTEMIGCFFRDGYDVYIFEQRGHGRSARAVENAQLVHVDTFSSYVRDTAAFVRRVIAPENYEALDLFSHSMGGAVAALYLAGDGCPVRRAVLSAPMIAPRSGKAPRPLVLWHLRRQGKKEGFSAPCSHAGHFNPNASFAHSSDNSPARFAQNLRVRCEDERFQTSSGSIGWTLEAIRVQSEILKKAKNIRCPVLLLRGTEDRVVRRDVQNRFLKRVKNAALYEMPGAKHGLFTASCGELDAYYTAIFLFLDEGSGR